MEAFDLRESIAEAAAASFQENSRDPFESLDRLLDAVEESRQMQGLAEIAGEALSHSPVDPPRYYLHAFALTRLGRPDEAVRPLNALCGKLEQEERWTLLASLLPRILDAAPSVDSARVLAKVGEKIGVGGIDGDALNKAYSQYPDEERLAYLMGERADSEGRKDEAIDYWADCLEGFARTKRYERLEETLLKVADSEKPEHQRQILQVIRILSEQGQWDRLDTYLELASNGLRAAGLMGILWKMVLNFATKAPSGFNIRKWIRELAPQAFPMAEGILGLLNRSGILDPQIRLEVSLRQLETLLDFAPGFHVLHISWGVGKVRLNDGDTIVVDFKDTKNHRMKLDFARRALSVIPPDDLRVLRSEAPEELRRLVREEPAEAVARALRIMRGEASAQDLRRTLTGQEIVSAAGWAAWWKGARTALESDPRFDLSQSFRQIYRLRAESGDGERVPLPAVELRRGIRPNVNLIRRFLEQHPEETARAAHTYTPILERWADAKGTSAEDRLAVHLQLVRWRREVRDDFRAALAACIRAAVELSAFADTEDQEKIADAALEEGRGDADAALFLFSSRSDRIRERALEAFRNDPEKARARIASLLQDPVDRPGTALALISLALDPEPEPFAPDPWLAALAAGLLVEGVTKEPIRKQALSLLSGTGPLHARAGRTELDDLGRGRWTTLLRRWKSSERHLAPVLDFLSATGGGSLAQEARQARLARAEKIFGKGSTPHAADYGGHLMTRATFQKLLHERNELVGELRTVIPEAIRRARELGDLRENAEYHAARQKQADHAHRVGELTRRLAEATRIEDLSPPEDETAPGSHVVVFDETRDQERAYWILGEGDDWIGPDVISYATLLGKSLLGRKVGERVTVTLGGVQTELVIRSTRRRLPHAEEQKEIEVTQEELNEIARIEEQGGEGPA